MTTVTCESLQPTARLAGFIAAHAIWSVSDGESLIAMVGSEAADGGRWLDRLVTERLEDAPPIGRRQLQENPRHSAHAALAFDGYVSLPTGKTDAIYVEARAYVNGVPQPLELAVPYRNANAPGGFAVYRPVLLKLPEGLAKCDMLIVDFWAGVDSHEKAVAVWNAHLAEPR